MRTDTGNKKRDVLEAPDDRRRDTPGSYERHQRLGGHRGAGDNRSAMSAARGSYKTGWMRV